MFNFKLGDVVYLKSGSVAMTITKMEKDVFSVLWFDFNKCKLRESDIPHDSLTIVNPNPAQKQEPG
jgi:uncharacterized protein YodC (DUF2158 family)